MAGVVGYFQQVNLAELVEEIGIFVDGLPGAVLGVSGEKQLAVTVAEQQAEAEVVGAGVVGVEV